MDEDSTPYYRPRGRRNLISVAPQVGVAQVEGGRNYNASLGGAAAEQSADRAIALYHALEEDQTNEDTLVTMRSAFEILGVARKFKTNGIQWKLLGASILHKTVELATVTGASTHHQVAIRDLNKTLEETLKNVSGLYHRPQLQTMINISSDAGKVKQLADAVDQAINHATQAVEARKAELSDKNASKTVEFSRFWDILVDRKIITPTVTNLNESSTSIRLKGVQNWNGVIVKDSEHSIGIGGFSTVFKGKWTESIAPDLMEVAPKQSVVVKILRIVDHRGDAEKIKHFIRHLEREVVVWQTLVNDNIVPFIGMIPEIDGCPALISLFMVHGTVKDYVQQNPGCNRMPLLEGIGNGLEYLHYQAFIVHGDLKGVNVLVDENGNPRLTDFGFSRMLDTSDLELWHSSRMDAPGTIRWMAPELLNGDQVNVTVESDVYAYAMTCLEIMTGEMPFAHLRHDYRVILAVINNEERPSRQEKDAIPEQLWSLWEECWKTDPSKRPVMREVVNAMIVRFPKQ